MRYAFIAVLLLLSNIAQAQERGAYPSNYEALIREWYAQNLKDPDSAKFQRITKPREEQVMRDGAFIYGYSVCAVVNAKNSYGGYAGPELDWFFIRDGVIVREQPVDVVPIVYIGHPVVCE